MTAMITTTEILIRLSIASVLGSVVGIERQRREWTAGLRTHMLVCVGSALIMLVSTYGFQDVIGREGYMLDPARVAAQVISGIGFLGAGTILFLRQQVVKGLTTAAGLWTVAAIGLAVGGGLYIAAASTTVIVLIILAVIKPLENRFLKLDRYNVLKLTVRHQNKDLQAIEDLLNQNKLSFIQINLKTIDDNTDEVKVILPTLALKKPQLLVLMQQFQDIKGVQEAEFVLK